MKNVNDIRKEYKLLVVMTPVYAILSIVIIVTVLTMLNDIGSLNKNSESLTTIAQISKEDCFDKYAFPEKKLTES